MKALVKQKKGKGFLEITECDKPTPKENEVLSKVFSAERIFTLECSEV